MNYEVTVKCDEIRERMPDVAAGFRELAASEAKHLESCAACAEQLKGMRATMALLDEWQTPEPSAYFDTRLQARLREEMARPQALWLQWLRRPALAAALTVLLGVGIGVLVTGGGFHPRGTAGTEVTELSRPGTAVGDLQSLEKDHEMYADFELLDDLDLQQDVVANP